MDKYEFLLANIRGQLVIIIIIMILMGLSQCSDSKPKDTRWVLVDGKVAYLQTLPDLVGPMQSPEFRGYVIFMSDSVTVCRAYVTKEKGDYKAKSLKKTLLTGDQAQLWAGRLEQRMFEVGKY